ncbi:hypothetical protein XELAEV_18005949mg [Xenopus laevis]|uniref:Uncharacterized protein n=1 Tax=Xenopus laevis TaxID=8355 RepID=A0A974E085_XENLA|nr:hypothetical protein XELAEV_18005949mg [Xenopus laevis]
MEMALLEARNMLPPSGRSEVPVHVHKLNDSTSNAHCFNCGGSRHKVADTPVHNLEQNDCTPDNSEINTVGKDNANFKLCHCVITH